MIPVHDISENEKKEIGLMEIAGSNYSIREIHRHQFFECFVFSAGGGSHQIDFIEYPIRKNSIHIICPGQVHQLNRKAATQGFVFLFELYQLSANKTIENFLLDHSCYDVQDFSPVYSFGKEFHHDLSLLMKNAWIDFQKFPDLRNELMKNQLTQLLLFCLQVAKTKKLHPNQKDNQLYLAFRKLLLQRFKELKMVKDYAAALNVSEKILNEATMRRNGVRASSIIYNQLILESKRLLNTGMSAKEIAFELNFSDQAHFSKFFKAHTGLSPSEF